MSGAHRPQTGDLPAKDPLAAMRSPTVAPDRDAVLWHDVECAGYAADLPVWRALARERPGAVLELGAGTGRVALDLAARGHEMWALDSDPALVGELRRRAQERRLSVEASAGDAREFELRRSFGLAIAPMQVVQLLGGPEGRAAMLAATRRHMERGGVLALAVADPLEGVPDDEDPLPPLPDVREEDGWVLSSRPVAVREDGPEIVVERVREAVSPDGRLRTSAATVRLERLDGGELGAQALGLGFTELEPRRVAPTEAYVGSTIVVLEAT
jgi:SAM-dependent methyltransferase